MALKTCSCTKANAGQLAAGTIPLAQCLARPLQSSAYKSQRPRFILNLHTGRSSSTTPFFLTNSQAGDDKEVDTKLKEQLAKERAKAAIQARMNKKRPAEDSDASSAVADLISAESSKVAAAESSAANSAAEEGEVNEPDRKKARKGKKSKKDKKK